MIKLLRDLLAQLRSALEAERWDDLAPLDLQIQDCLEYIRESGKLDDPEYQEELARLQAFYWQLITLCKQRRDHFRELTNQSLRRKLAAKAYNVEHKVL